MNITIHPTTKIVALETENGFVQACIWEGVTDTGIRVNAFITRIVPIMERDDSRQIEFQTALEEVEQPSTTANSWPSRLVL